MKSALNGKEVKELALNFQTSFTAVVRSLEATESVFIFLVMVTTGSWELITMKNGFKEHWDIYHR